MQVYRDDSISVAVGVSMREEVGVDGQHVARDLSNSIKISALAQSVHFVQFVTHIVADEFEFSNSEGQIQQRDFDLNSFYSVEVELCDCLPEWALRLIKDHYDSRQSLQPEVFAQLPSPVLPPEALCEEALADFLVPPEAWITRRLYPALFDSPVRTVELGASNL